MTESWNMLQHLEDQIAKSGGLVSCHAHFDKAYVITPETLKMSEDHMEVKWELWKKVKQSYTHADLVERISRVTQMMIDQGCTVTRTNIDVDNTVGMMCVEAALEVKERFKDQIDLQICSQVLEGALDPKAQAWIEQAAQYVDVLGGLPSYDRPRQADHLDVIFDMAKRYNKGVDVHIDQNNDPDERDTEILAQKVIEHGLQGRVNAVHAASLSAQDDGYIRDVVKLIKQANMGVIVCPRAMLDNQQPRHKLAPVHNSIAPVRELVEGGVTVALGVDNVYDYFCPFIDGNLMTELICLIETTRLYDVDSLVAIASANGHKLLSQTAYTKPIEHATMWSQD